MSRTSVDFETFRLGPAAVAPKPICWTSAVRQGAEVAKRLVSNGDGPVFEAEIERMLRDGETVWHNGPSFDLLVISIHMPRLMSLIWESLEAGRIRDTMIREQLLNLALHGYVDSYWIPNPVEGKPPLKKNASYALSRLVYSYLGADRSGVKGTGEVKEDVWRLHYDTLDGVPSAKFPADAAAYAVEDAVDTLLVSECQDALARDRFQFATFPDGTPFDVFRTEPLHCGAGFALALMTVVGFGVDRAEVKVMKDAVSRALRPSQTALLFSSGILERAVPPQPYKNGARNPDGSLRMKKGKAQKKNNKKLLEIALEVHAQHSRCDEADCPRFDKECEDHGLPPLRRTEPSSKFPEGRPSPTDPEGLGGQISVDSDSVASLVAFSPVLAQYERWQGLQKLETLEIPLLEGTDVIHASFDILKKTGRTSSRKSKHYPSRNIQQIPRGFEVEEVDDDGKPVLDEKGKQKKIKIEPRHCYVPRTPGWVLISIDYSFLELVSVAQTVYRVIGESRLRDIINDGIDPHAFLGAILASGCDPEFAELLVFSAASTPMDVYRVFASLKTGSDDEKKFYKMYRSLSKTCGLAFAGGMGPKKLLDYARQTYGVVIESLEKARQYKELWFQAFPEMKIYLQKYIRDHLKDEQHSSEDRPRFAYFTPMGAYRSRCSYTEAANGFGLQSPSGEGAKLAVFHTTRACWDPAMNSCLYGCHPLAFVHDEMLIEMPNDSFMSDRAFEASRIMVDSMKVVFPDTKITAEPAAMAKWDKAAESVYGSDDRLRVWEPTVRYKADATGKLRVPS